MNAPSPADQTRPLCHGIETNGPGVPYQSGGKQARRARPVGKPQRELPKTLNQASAKRLLEAHGWVKETGGRHETKMVKPGERPVTLPYHRGRD